MGKPVWILALGVLALFLPEPAKAWGENGHLVVCEVAYRNLTPTARDQLNFILQTRGQGTVVRAREGVEQRTYTSFNVGCLEEDERPRKHPKDHFLNVPRNLGSIQDGSCPAASPRDDANCVFSGIERDLRILADRTRTKEDRAFALMAIGHWMGDLHQPLHISFADDVGGNNIPVRLRGGCGGSSYRVQNFHGLWDNCLLEAGLFEKVRRRAEFNGRSIAGRTLAYRAADTIIANTSLAAEIGYAQGEIWQWAAESYDITRSAMTGYCAVQGQLCKPRPLRNGALELDQSYLAVNRNIAEDRVARAGFRLAHMLNRALDPGYSGPVADGLQPS